MDKSVADALDRIEQGISNIFSAIDGLNDRLNQHGKMLTSLQVLITPAEAPKGPTTQELLAKLGKDNKEGLADLKQQVRLVGEAIAEVPEKTAQTLRLTGRAP